MRKGIAWLLRENKIDRIVALDEKTGRAGLDTRAVEQVGFSNERTAGDAEWLLTAYLLVQQRLALGLPWQRMALILCAVAVFTAASALVFRSAALRARFGGSSG